MKTIMINSLMCAALGMGAVAYAGEEHKQCDLELNYGLKITPEYVEFVDGKDSVVKISGDHVLRIDGEVIDLKRSSKKLVEDYQYSIRKTVPQVGEVAIDAVELAERAVNTAFSQAFNVSDDALAELTALKKDLVQEISKHFNAKDGRFYINAGDVDHSIGTFTEDFEKRFEATVEKVVQQSLGSILMEIGKQMVSSGGDMDDFGKRMETMGSDIEVAVDEMAKNIEGKMYSLCNDIQAIDHLEDALYKEVPEFKGHDLIDLKRS